MEKPKPIQPCKQSMVSKSSLLCMRPQAENAQHTCTPKKKRRKWEEVSPNLWVRLPAPPQTIPSALQRPSSRFVTPPPGDSLGLPPTAPENPFSLDRGQNRKL
uniref:Uncharacterized protein n=1 Tax=Eutreptiella gymnastica TaxID=73025 RepID=A0A7S4D2Y4_9EUGL